MNKIFRVLTLCEFSGQVPWAVHVHLHVHVGVHVRRAFRKSVAFRVK